MKKIKKIKIKKHIKISAPDIALSIYISPPFPSSIVIKELKTPSEASHEKPVFIFSPIGEQLIIMFVSFLIIFLCFASFAKQNYFINFLTFCQFRRILLQIKRLKKSVRYVLRTLLVDNASCRVRCTKLEALK
jgi:hypothetical protein